MVDHACSMSALPVGPGPSRALSVDGRVHCCMDCSSSGSLVTQRFGFLAVVEDLLEDLANLCDAC